MRIHSIRQFLAASFLIVALAACAPIQAPATTEAPATTVPATAEPAATASDVTPNAIPIESVDSATCDAIQAAIQSKLNHEFTKQADAACTLTATGTGEDFGNFVDVAQSIREVLVAEGWTEDESTLADGPTGTASSYFKATTVAAVNVNWEPAEEANCPTDQPISACDVEPSQQNFTITIELVKIA